MDSRTGRAAAVVLAGGSGTRVGGDRNKVYRMLAGETVIVRALAAVAALPEVGPLVLVVRAEDREHAVDVLEREWEPRGRGGAAIEVVTGGATRQASELAGLRRLATRIGRGEIDVVLVHDGARPLAGPALVASVLRTARDSGGAVPGLLRHDVADATPDGVSGPAVAGLVAVQTPQGFRAGPLLAAYEAAARTGFAGTDTASCVARFAPEVVIRWVPGEERNFKITYSHDLRVAEAVLAASPAR